MISIRYESGCSSQTTHAHTITHTQTRTHNAYLDVGVLRTSLLNAAVAGETFDGVVIGGMLPVEPLRELLKELLKELLRDADDELNDEWRELFKESAL